MAMQNASEQHLPFKEKFAYGVGDFGYNFLLN